MTGLYTVISCVFPSEAGILANISRQREDDSEAEEDEQEALQKVEQQLLQYDPDFTINETAAKRAIRKQRLLNAFVRGMAPEDPLDSFDAGNPEHAAQLHLNIERMRVPEVTYQPSLAGIDSAGLLEVIEHILKSFTASERDRLTAVGTNLVFYQFSAEHSTIERLRDWRIFADRPV